MAAVQNLNPTILSAADLPSRRSRNEGSPVSQSPVDKNPYEGTLFASSWAKSSALVPDPFSIYIDERAEGDEASSSSNGEEDLLEEPIDEQEIFDLISTISDPEHPLSLAELAVVSLPDIAIRPTLSHNPSSPLRTVTVLITPTITHCSLATVIGLGVRVRLEESLPARFRIDVRIKEGTHSTGEEVNKQLADKERVAAALENGTLMGVIGRMLETCK